nr:nitroreductase [Kibdelosporangium sp. MJ126-NF4]
MSETWETFAGVLERRHCKRSFVDRPVSRALLERVLATAGCAPSTRNGQPWRVSVLTGTARQALADALCAEFDRGVAQHADYVNRPSATDAVTESRAREAGEGVLRAKGIDRFDTGARRAHLRDNLAFYGAPVEMVFHLPGPAPHGLFLEMGLFLQNVMLALVACGLGSCPQFSVAGYPDVIRAVLGLPDDRVVVCGLAVGYPDEAAKVNRFRPVRAAVDEYVRWHGSQ